ncbi:putative DEAD/DEAH box DNA helicase (Mer3) [Aspergillus melleus]|uniref:putative DEAD/DEAH box DNA helicase (Mer3) n=1 Tax=Aspergillus melleus TaxID=138277 RepID=UPI001E8EE1B5|nr:ATP-dependent DNA helicase MER3 [Aspergillus melleus]KAH8435304.1 ATP-dependent DNA helicase MER3 [Aspergillus melleus]
MRATSVNNGARADIPKHDAESQQAGEQQSRSAYDTTLHSPNKLTSFQNIPMSIRGIVLVSVRELPDNYRSIFHFPVFNAVQSKSFRSVYKTGDNIVLAAPTGSGKTVIMELAICRLLANLKDERFKVVYQAPTKSLCSERFRDWNRKFQTLGLQCAELTGDTDHTQMRNVQNSQIIITTPEKWDSMTRKWKDHTRLMQLVKLFLIDEVHILKETRGATLEAVVSRMKAIGSNVRFVALSATIPNSEDVATWLGKDAMNQHVPAHREHFGEEFRPVKLQKFVYGYQSHGNDFAFDKICSSKLPDIIAAHSCRKPIMIFCCTRNSTVATAKELVRLWSTSNPPARLWKGPNERMEAHNVDLKGTLVAGVAFHHAGLDPADRHTVETGFLEGQVNIICCTSTLAVGVNLPCHLVIVKNTVGWQDGGCREYSDLEIMQMLGRAGRPQFDDSSTAVILTRKERVNYYERLCSGSESLESCLHLNLIDHLNAEIGLGNVTDIESAIKWLAGTFLFVRLRRNPTHYHLKEGANRDDEDEMLRQICEKDINLLRECGLIAPEQLRSTQYGDAMARYYVRFETMKTFLSLKPRATISQIFSVVVQAEEFREVRLKSGEKSLYKELNRANGIRFPVKVDIALPAHKVSLLIQAELGAVDIPDGEQFQKHKFSFQQDKSFVFSHVNRLIRCIIDCQIALADSVAVRHALDLARSFGAKVWDYSALQMKQIDQIGIVAVRKLSAAGITSLEALELTEAHRIDMILSKNPPFGMKVLSRVADFPKLLVSVRKTGRDVKPGCPIRIRFTADIAFMNEKCPIYFQRRPIYVCFLAETSGGHLIDFRRISASKLQSNHGITLSAEIKDRDQSIKCHVMCDDIVGTLRSAEIQTDLPQALFPTRSTVETPATNQNRLNTSLPHINGSQTRLSSAPKTDTFDSDDQLFNDFLETDCIRPSKYTTLGHKEQASVESAPTDNFLPLNEITEPVRLENGKWACNHKCRDKTACKHFCCRDGLDKPPKGSKKQHCPGTQKQEKLSQLTLSASVTKRPVQHEPLKAEKKNYLFPSGPQPSSASTSLPPSHSPGNPRIIDLRSSSDYGDDSFDDLPSPSALLLGKSTKAPFLGTDKPIEAPNMEDLFKGDDWLFADEPLHLTQTAADDCSPYHNEVVGQGLDRDSIPSQKKEVSANNPNESQVSLRIKSSSPEDDTSVNPIFNSPSLSPDCPKGMGTATKRKLSQIAPNHQEYDHREPKQRLTEKRVSTQDRPSAAPGTSTMPPDWDDIDPALLDEFKDIINFF